MYQQTARAAIDGRVNGSVAELQAGGFDRGLIGSHGSYQGVGGGAILVALLARNDAGFKEFVVALGIGLGILSGGFVLFEVRLRLLQRRLERPRIDHEEHVTLVHVLAFGELDLLQSPADFTADGDGAVRLHVADSAQFNRRAVLRRGGDGDRNGRRACGGCGFRRSRACFGAG